LIEIKKQQKKKSIEYRYILIILILNQDKHLNKKGCEVNFTREDEVVLVYLALY
jgi:hypothetical protein